jgi:hypothetical protein
VEYLDSREYRGVQVGLRDRDCQGVCGLLGTKGILWSTGRPKGQIFSGSVWNTWDPRDTVEYR